MFALLPVLGGLILGRFCPARPAIGIQVALYGIAAAVLIATAPEHGASRTSGIWLSMALAPLSALTVFIGWAWRRRSTSDA